MRYIEVDPREQMELFRANQLNVSGFGDSKTVNPETCELQMQQSPQTQTTADAASPRATRSAKKLDL